MFWYYHYILELNCKIFLNMPLRSTFSRLYMWLWLNLKPCSLHAMSSKTAFSVYWRSLLWPTFENTHASKESVMCRMYFQKKDIYETQPASTMSSFSFVFIECCTLLLTLFTYHHRAPISSFAEKRLRQQQCIIETWDERLEIALSMSTLSKNWSFDRQTPYFQRKVLLKVNLMVYFSSSSPKPIHKIPFRIEHEESQPLCFPDFTQKQRFVMKK